MKKLFVFLLVVLMGLGVLTSCSDDSKTSKTNNEKKLSIVCTVFPEYDWVKQILGSGGKDAEITMLLDNGVDLHSYQPTADDIIKISNCDMFIYVGGESDEWVEDALKEATNKDMVVVNLLNVLGSKVKEEETKEGMEATEHVEHHEEEEGPEYDEHVWLSLKNAETLTRFISEKLCDIDSANAKAYRENTDNYILKLNDLDGRYEETVDNAKNKTLLFGDRFPFRYMVDDYNLDYFAAFVGCSAETEASFETIKFLAGKADELGLSSVVTIEGAEHKIAETIVKNTAEKNQKIITMDSMQSTTSQDVKSGTTYLSVMKKNLEVLKVALN